MNAMNSQIVSLTAWLREVAPDAQLASDSRRIEAGDVFFAYQNDGADGRAYIGDAIARGASAVIFEDAKDLVWTDSSEVPHRAVPHLKDVAGQLAAGFYGQPDAAMFTVAVTGTNGKTSCSQWLGEAVSQLGEKAAIIGTLGVSLVEQGKHGECTPTGYTTPDAVLLQRTLAECRDAGAVALAIEASSIGLHQGRLNGMHFDVALFTNFTRDHLDYHGDMAAYEAAKTMLFDWPDLKHAVINLDDEMGVRLAARLKNNGAVRVIGYSLCGKTAAGATPLHATDVRLNADGSVFQLNTESGSATVKTKLIGQFNVSNVLGILGVLLAKGIDLAVAVKAIESLTAVSGRMQQFGGQDAPLVVVDYAHTPDALEKTLGALRQVAAQRTGRLWCVFGCGGDRDAGKRPQMGMASNAADHVVVTSDNPRSESPDAIIAQILAGMDRDLSSTTVIEDRAAAILWSIRHASKQDVVLLAGKGHENYQEIKGKKLPFLDADHAALALAARATMKDVS